MEVLEGLTERIGGGGVGREVGEWVLGNSEGMRENRSYVSMETVILIESSVPDWGCGIKSQRKTTVCHESKLE